MITPRMRAQQPLVEAADRLQALVREGAHDGFASVALEDDPASVILFWKGALPQPVQRLVDELRSTVRIVVRAATYSLDALLEESRRIISVDRSDIGVKVWSVGPLRDCSGLHLELDQSTDMARAQQEVRSPMKLEFRVCGPIVPA